MLNFQIKNFKDSFFYLLLFAVILLELIYFKIQLGNDAHSIFYIIKSSLADASIIMLVCLLLRNYWKYLTLLIPIALSVFIVSNILYYRYFLDLVPFSFYAFGGSFNQAVQKATLSAINYLDITIILTSLLPAFYVFIWIRNVRFITSKPPVGFIMADGVIILCSWILIMFSVNHHVRKMQPVYSFKDVLNSQLFSDKTSLNQTYEHFQITGYFIRGMYDMFFNKNSKSLNNDGIKDYLSRKGKNLSIWGKENPKPQNLILIIVESLQSNVFEISQYDYIIPTLAKLYNDSTIIHFDCSSLVGLGNSSDAQFMYNTGLLPLRNEPLVIRYAQRNYPSLAKALGINSLEIIGEDRELWNHKFTTKSFGFQNLVDNVANWGTFNQDSLIFKEAESQLLHLAQPFFLFITTLSMHPEYNESTTSHSLDPNLLNYTDKYIIEYLQRLNYFDTQLGYFLEFLKNNDLYNNSLIVIVGDHPILDPDIPEYFKPDKVPALIINSPSLKIRKDEITQLDLYPTILDIFGKHYITPYVEYYGLGTSVFCPEGELPSEKDYIISTIFIKNDTSNP